jgi:hypothetical protein
MNTAMSMLEAQAWMDIGLVRSHNAAQWRGFGFTPSGASRWLVEDREVEPADARDWHLALHGLTNGLGPTRSGWQKAPWSPPRTKAERGRTVATNVRSGRFASRTCFVGVGGQDVTHKDVDDAGPGC